MLFSKIARQIIALVPFVAIAIIFPLKDVRKFLSGSETQGDLASILEFAIYYLIILIIYLLLYEIILMKLYLSTSLKLEDVGERAVCNEKIGRALFAVRFNYLVTRVYRFLNLGQITYGYQMKIKFGKA